MIRRIQLLRNIGQFDSVTAPPNLEFKKVALIYAENGRGKTTLSAIFRSLATGDPIPVAERKRLAAQNPPHVVLECTGGPPSAVFENNAWNRTLPNLAVFDDGFVDANVYSGLAVGPDHRQNLHELILGSRGVALNREVQDLVAQIEAHNVALRPLAAAIPTSLRGDLSVDEFCSLPSRVGINEEIQSAERNLAAVREQAPVRDTPPLESVNLPAFVRTELEGTLSEVLTAIDPVAFQQIQAHLTGGSVGAEGWIAEGMSRVVGERVRTGQEPCPFCAQDLGTSPLFAHYRAYFGEEYRNLRKTIADSLAELNRVHSGQAAAGFERSLRKLSEGLTFWSRFCDTPTLAIETADILADWDSARAELISLLGAKAANPLERIELSQVAIRALARYEAHRDRLADWNRSIEVANAAIRVVKERAAAGNVSSITSDLNRLRAVRARHTPHVVGLCDAYLSEKTAKARTEQLRDQARESLNEYRTTAFPGYQTAINLYLERFNAGFRLDQITASNVRGGPTCTYNVVVNNVPVPVAGGQAGEGVPSFRNTLSAGDRNTLALSFFFASLDQDPNCADKVVVIDDPVSSLDEHRTLTTVQELRRLAERAAQVIVLSHSKGFLCRTWEGVDSTLRSALKVARDGAGSTLAAWDVDEDSATEHDRRHKLLREFIATGSGNNREVARAIRPLLEAFLRVACAEHFPAGTLLGPFRGLCEQKVGTHEEILNAQALSDLGDLTEYANRFHHDTNPAWETESINDGELAGFVTAALDFAGR